MTGPLFKRDKDGKWELIECCKDCAFAIYGEQTIDTTCFMDPCPCLPIMDVEEDTPYSDDKLIGEWQDEQ